MNVRKKDFQQLDAALLRQMMQHMPHVVSVVDRQRRLVWVNLLDEKELESIVGRRVEEFINEAATHVAAEAIEMAFTTGKATKYEAIGQRPGRPAIWYDTTVVPLPTEGASEPHAMLLSIDITQQHRAEQALKDSEHRFRMVTETSPDTILIVDADHRVVYLNRDPPPESGATRADLIGRTVEQLTHASDADKARVAVDRALTLGEPETYEVRGGVSGRDYINRVMRLPGEGSGPQALITATDVTEQRRADEKQAALQAQLQQSQKLEVVGQLAGGVAHDFNNVLLVIRSHLDFAMAAAEQREDVMPELRTIAAAAERASDMTRRLLTIGRRAHYAPTNFDLADFARRTMMLLDRMMPESIEVELQEAKGPFPVFADSAQLEQVLINICLNARDAISDVGKITVSVDHSSAEAAADTTHAFALRVTDTGEGMTDAVMSRIFEPFFTTKAPGKGTGLGLSMAHSIVTENGGQVDVVSSKGGGTTFSILLPRAGTPRTPNSTFAPSDREYPAGIARLLVAEDEPSVRAVVVRILKRAGYDVLEAENGKQAIELFRENAEGIDLVLLDAVMPLLGGKEAYEEITRMRPDVPVLFSSGYLADTLPPSFLASHGLQVLTKPYRPAALIGAVHDALLAARKR